MNFNKNYQILYAVIFVFFMFYKPVICFLMLGTVFLIYVVYTVLYLNDISKNGIEIRGEIVSYESGEEKYKTPIIEFQIAEEKKITGKPFFYTSSNLDQFRSHRENINKTVK
ncbi:hypothetical protein EYY60_06835 [Flavobacterium zhairuonense]|uniref:hypothetical protein n=1 Tax=Flavobacterium zhairuonense TaxID=2493631 RepID=UPI001053156E|nr:hypothetical protein [Flavobacterium zhairuonense]KAF2512818.1 hypothetical protein EYY60_06835 [Flavobacterium zhairuonense]